VREIPFRETRTGEGYEGGDSVSDRHQPRGDCVSWDTNRGGGTNRGGIP